MKKCPSMTPQPLCEAHRRWLSTGAVLMGLLAVALSGCGDDQGQATKTPDAIFSDTAEIDDTKPPDDVAPPEDIEGDASNVCGDGVFDEGEQCDGQQLGARTCAALEGFDSGELSCTSACVFDTSQCVQSPVMLPSLHALTSGGGVTTSSTHRAIISVGAPQPYTASGAQHRMTLGPILPR